MAFTNDIPIPKSQAVRLLGYSFPITDVESDSDAKAIVFSGLYKSNSSGVYLMAVMHPFSNDIEFKPDPDFCFDCAPFNGPMTFGHHAVKDYTGFTVRQLIDRVRKAEGTLVDQPDYHDHDSICRTVESHIHDGTPITTDFVRLSRRHFGYLVSRNDYGKAQHLADLMGYLRFPVGP